MDFRLLYPSDWLGSPDLMGAERVVTIRKIAKDKIQTKDGKTEEKAVVWLDELKAKAEKDGTKEKRWIMNKTCARTIAKLYGPDTDKWIGRQITLFPTTANAFGEMVDCIRVKPSIPAPTKPEKAEAV